MGGFGMTSRQFTCQNNQCRYCARYLGDRQRHCPKCGTRMLVEKPTLVVTIEGGVVQSISSDQPEAFEGITFRVIDYDTEGADLEYLSTVPQSGVRRELAVVREMSVENLGIDLGGIRAATQADIDKMGGDNEHQG